jgi:hypothetical protein
LTLAGRPIPSTFPAEINGFIPHYSVNKSVRDEKLPVKGNHWRTISMQAPIVTAMFLLVLFASAAFAGQSEADQCAAGLNPDSKMIYDDVAPKVTASTNLRDAVTSATRSLVMGGKVPRSSAKASAEAAGACLELLKS